MENELILKALESLSKKLDDLQPVKQALRSPQLNELYGALAKAQSEMKSAGKSTDVEFYTKTNKLLKRKYADLDSLVTASRPALTKYGLAVKFDIVMTEDGGGSILNTTLCHESGQFETTQVRIVPEGSDTQSYGKQLTYLQRFTYKLVTGVVASSDPDDDDSAGEVEKEERRITPDFLRKPKEEKSLEVITKYQLQEIETELDGYTELAEEILNKLDLRSFADLPQSKAEGVLKRIRDIKSKM